VYVGYLKAVILAGGYGKRLKPLTDNKPKPLVEVGGTPIIEWQINWLRSNEIKEVIICTGYLKESVINYIGSGKKFGVKVGYSVEEQALGTGGALRNAETLLSGDRFIMLNGDILTSLDPWQLVKSLEDGVLGVIASVPLRSPFGILDLEGEFVKGFKEKPQLPDYWINAGVYCLHRNIIEHLPHKGDIEAHTFPRLAEQHKVKVVRYDNAAWKSIDTHKDIEEAEREFKPTSTPKLTT
jgi:NDP-sugar pyrophosphorylase family protein